MSKKPTVEDLHDAILDLAGGLGGLTAAIKAFAIQVDHSSVGPLSSVIPLNDALQLMQGRIKAITDALGKAD
jgi:hypothetical protein